MHNHHVIDVHDVFYHQDDFYVIIGAKFIVCVKGVNLEMSLGTVVITSGAYHNITSVLYVLSPSSILCL